MNLENKTVEELEELKKQVEEQLSKKFDFWQGIDKRTEVYQKNEVELSQIRKREQEIRDEEDFYKSKAEKKIEDLGFRSVIQDYGVSFVNYSFKYEPGKFYSIEYDRETNKLTKKIEEVSDEDVEAIAQILGLKD